MSYAKELWDTPIKVNRIDPGWCATDINGGSGYRSAEQGAAIAVRLATLGADGPSGAFLQDAGPSPGEIPLHDHLVTPPGTITW